MPIPSATISCASPHPHAVPGDALDHLGGQVGLARHTLEDTRDLASLQSLADHAPGERAEDPTLRYAASLEPLVHERHAVARDVRHCSFSLGVGLGAAHQHGRRAIDFLHDIRHLQGDELAPAQ